MPRRKSAAKSAAGASAMDLPRQMRELDGDDDRAALGIYAGDDGPARDENEPLPEELQPRRFEGMDEGEDEDDEAEMDGAGESDDEYDEDDEDLPIPDDSSDSSEEQPGNTVGDIPLSWYDDYDHIGYDLEGKKILKSAVGGDGNRSARDALDEFISRSDDPDYWRTVRDVLNDKDVVLSLEDVELLERLHDGKIPHPDVDPYPEYVDWFDWSKESMHPVRNVLEPKRRFVRSVGEHKKISSLVQALRTGKWRPNRPVAQAQRWYDIWGAEKEETGADRNRAKMHVPAPKLPLPGHQESYHPPPEYLPTEEEAQEWKDAHPEDRTMPFLPQQFESLRKVPAYPEFIQERFERCLDLYLCPRVRKQKLHIDPASLLPKLPDPQDLRPFPSLASTRFTGHTDKVVSVSPDPSGQWLASGSTDKTLRIWEIQTGRCARLVRFDGEVRQVVWSPNRDASVILVVVGRSLHIVTPSVGAPTAVAGGRALFEEWSADGAGDEAQQHPARKIEWTRRNAAAAGRSAGIVASIGHQHDIKHVNVHRRGDYLAVVYGTPSMSHVVIHQLSAQHSRFPLRSRPGIQRCSFHPSKPLFFVADQRQVRMYHLLQKEGTRTFTSTTNYVSDMDVHPGGDNFVLSGYDRRLCWIDVDLGKPYKSLRHHSEAVRAVRFHPRLPLLASGGDDCSVHVFHAQVYNDLSQDPLIVPVKILHAHKRVGYLGILDIAFHPFQPWLFSAGADGAIQLFIAPA